MPYSEQELVCTDRAPTFDRVTFRVLREVISEQEEASLLRELSLPLNRMRYENTHWDSVSTSGAGA